MTKLSSKRSGVPMGFSVDWRMAKAPSCLPKILGLRANGFHVSYNVEYPYVDVFFAPADKAKALTTLKQQLRIKGPVMYLGDSTADNSCFRAADVSVGVSHGQSLKDLECEFIVDWPDLARFVSLISRGMISFPSSSTLIRRK